MVPARGFPGGASCKELASQYRGSKRCGFDPWVGKVPWRRAWQPTLAFLPGEFHGQRNQAGCSPDGCKEPEATEATWHEHTYSNIQRGSRLLLRENQVQGLTLGIAA